MATTRIAVMQIGYDHLYGPAGRTLDDNIGLIAGYLDAAGRERADLAIAPECWVRTGLPDAHRPVPALAEEIPGNGPIYSMFRDRAKHHQMHVIGWSFEKEGAAFYNTAFIIAPDGSFIGRYRKTHPVPVEETDKDGITPGEELPVFDLPFGRIGIMICFDNFFPEVPRVLAIKGARLICYPSMNSPQLCLAVRSATRAIENGCFVASSVVLGERLAEGEAAVHDPKGTVVASPGHRDGIAVAEIDLYRKYSAAYYVFGEDSHFADVRRFRMTSRRPHLYREITNDAVL